MSLLNTLGLLWRFHGGVHLPEHKQESTGLPIAPLAAAGELVLPLQQHIGAPARPCVRVGQHVARGEPIARADGYVSAPLHAPTSGHIIAIEPRPIAHPSGIDAPAIVLAADGEDRWHADLPAPLATGATADPALLRARVRESGIVGLGGAAFPSAVKLNAAGRIRVLILNAAECEPYLSCDDLLMRERAHEVVGGLLLMRHALGAGRCLIGIEDNKPEAAAALGAALKALGATDIELRVIPTLYPSGSEQQLIRVLTGVEVARSRRPVDSGILCQNVGTAAAVYAAVTTGRPLVSRIVTVTGAGVARPRNLEVAIGTPVQALIEACGGYTARAQRLILGGPMMGLAVADDTVPVTKGMGCVLVAAAEELAPPAPTLPCIRCGACMDVCPANLLPQQLYWYARGREFDKAQATRLFDCIECGACAAVCPSRLPLVQYYRYAKSEIGAAEREQQKAEQARRRHEFRSQRIEREEAERQARLHAKKTRATAPAAAPAGEATAADDPKKAAIAAALARAEQRKAGKTDAAPAPGADSTSAAPAVAEALAATPALDEAKLAKLAAARARAEAKKTAAGLADAAVEPAAPAVAETPAESPAAVPALDAAKLAKLAAARARAEAKKAAAGLADAAVEPAAPVVAETPAESPAAGPALDEAQLAKLAATRARAEAKKAAAAEPSDPSRR